MSVLRVRRLVRLRGTLSDHPFSEKADRLGRWADGVGGGLFVLAVILTVALVWLYALWRLASWALGLPW